MQKFNNTKTKRLETAIKEMVFVAIDESDIAGMIR